MDIPNVSQTALDEHEAAQLLLDLGTMEDFGELEMDGEPNTADGDERHAKITKAKKKSLFEFQNSKRRALGQNYKGVKKVKEGSSFVFDRPARKMEPKCPQTSFCNKKTKTFHCKSLTEDQRKKIHAEFWSHEDWEWKRIYIKGLVTRHEPQRTSVPTRDYSFKYFLPFGQSGNRSRVCAKTFAATFAISHATIVRWLKEDDVVQQKKPKKAPPPPEAEEQDEAASTTQPKPLPKNQIECSEFFDKLPRLESHYCRKNDDKLYIERNWSSKRGFYRYIAAAIMYKTSSKNIKI
jgi:hypothetical protein